VTIRPPQSPVQSTGGAPAGSAFDIVRRGYDRDQVDAQLRELRDRLAAAEASRHAAEHHARATEDELRTARAQSPAAESAPISQESFGFRAEKILRMAEHEASDVRARAASEATQLVEKARADAERHRHEVEQSLITRTAELDQEATQRNVSLQEREQQAAATLSAAREEAARITENAEQAAETLLADARSRAEEIGKRSEQDLRRRREAAEQELRRIGNTHDGVRAELARLHTLLGGELGTSVSNGTPSKPSPGPANGRDARSSVSGSPVS
jgi:cell division septum initiation protein DivIVA